MNGGRPGAACACLTESICIFLCQSQFLHESINISFINTDIKIVLTNLCGNRPSQNDFMNAFCEIRSSHRYHGAGSRRHLVLKCGIVRLKLIMRVFRRNHGAGPQRQQSDNFSLLICRRVDGRICEMMNTLLLHREVLLISLSRTGTTVQDRVVDTRQPSHFESVASGDVFWLGTGVTRSYKVAAP